MSDTTTLFVRYSSYLVSSHTSEEEYGSWHSTSDFNVRGVGLTSNYLSNEMFTVGTKVDYADVVYVLWMVYSTGDSFGSSEGNGEILWVFKDNVLADRAYQLWKSAQEAKQDRNNNQSYSSIEFEVDGGERVRLNNPAWGYFEHVTSLELTMFLVEGQNEQKD